MPVCAVAHTATRAPPSSCTPTLTLARRVLSGKLPSEEGLQTREHSRPGRRVGWLPICLPRRWPRTPPTGPTTTSSRHLRSGRRRSPTRRWTRSRTKATTTGAPIVSHSSYHTGGWACERPRVRACSILVPCVPCAPRARSCPGTLAPHHTANHERRSGQPLNLALTQARHGAQGRGRGASAGADCALILTVANARPSPEPKPERNPNPPGADCAGVGRGGCDEADLGHLRLQAQLSFETPALALVLALALS